MSRILFALIIYVGLTSSCTDEPVCDITTSDFSFEAEENIAQGTIIGTVSASSTNNKAITYSILEGNNNSTFTVEPNTGDLSLSTGAQLDYEEFTSFSLTMSAVAEGCESTEFNTMVIIKNLVDAAYIDEFYSNIAKEAMVVYGDAEPEDQIMNVYYPQEAGQKARPLFVLAGGGAWSPSNLDYLEPMALRMAKAGYVVAAIRYHSDPELSEDSDPVVRLFKGVQDISAAIRYFRKDAAEDNHYNIDPDNVFAGGNGTGAFNAITAGYTSEDDLDAKTLKTLEDMGGIAGERGNPGYPSDFKATAALAGGIYDVTAIDRDEIPLICVHGTKDDVVDCSVGFDSTGNEVYGSCLMIDHAQAVGVQSQLVRVVGGHDAPRSDAGGFVEVLKFFETYIN